MIWAFDVREPFTGARFAERFHLAGRERELLIRPIGRTVYLMPPTCWTITCRVGWLSACWPRWTMS